MPIEFNCPECRQSMQAPDDFAGRKARCPKCMAIVSVPTTSVAPPEPVAPPPTSPRNFGLSVPKTPPIAPPKEIVPPKPLPKANLQQKAPPRRQDFDEEEDEDQHSRRKQQVGGKFTPRFDGDEEEDTRLCPMCGETIGRYSRACRFCGERFDNLEHRASTIRDPLDGKATTSLVMGIISLCLFCTILIPLICGIVGLVLGLQAMNSPNVRGRAMAGAILSVVGLVIAGIYLLFLIAN